MSTFPPTLYEERPSATRYLGAIRHHRVLIAFIVAISVIAAIGSTLTATKRYEAESELLVTPVSDDTGVYDGIKVLRDQDTAPLIVGRALKSRHVTEAVIRRVGLDTSSRELLKKVDIHPVQQSSTVVTKARDSDPELAARLANAFPRVYIDQETRKFRRQVDTMIERLRKQIQSGSGLSRGETIEIQARLAQLRSIAGSPDPTLEVLSDAIAPTDSVWPRPVLSLIVALFAGLIFGIAAALLVELADPRLNESELLDRYPIVAWVPRARASVVQRYLRGGGPLPTDLWESYRTLRASLSASGVGEGTPKTILVTSAIQAEGKTMTSSNLAIAMAAGGHRVILVDGDLRRSMVASVFGVDRVGKGLASLLSGTATPDEALTPSPGHGDRIRLLLAGDERPIDMLDPRRIEQLFSELKDEADVIIIDSPPLTEFADAVAFAEAADVVLFSVRLGHTRRDRFNESLRFLTRQGIVVTGFVVTARRRSFGDPYAARRGQMPIEQWRSARAREVEPTGPETGR
jgi:polysaccharide biosynthesis transport protein